MAEAERGWIMQEWAELDNSKPPYPPRLTLMFISTYRAVRTSREFCIRC